MLSQFTLFFRKADLLIVGSVVICSVPQVPAGDLRVCERCAAVHGLQEAARPLHPARGGPGHAGRGPGGGRGGHRGAVLPGHHPGQDLPQLRGGQHLLRGPGVRQLQGELQEGGWRSYIEL